MAVRRKPRSDFGEYLAALIREAGMSQFEFYSEAGIAKPYFYDMISGRTNPPPRDTLERMLYALEKRLPPDRKRRTDLFDRAALGRGEIPCDISEMILECPEQWDEIRQFLISSLKGGK